MGADARWVCHTCKTVCSGGGRPYLTNVWTYMSVEEVDQIKELISNLGTSIEIENKDSIIEFLDSLRVWLERHQGDVIHIGSDYSTDMMDLDDYHDETVDGQVSKLTRNEVAHGHYQEWKESWIRDIEAVIDESKQGKTTSRDAAIELFNRFRYIVPKGGE